MKRNKRNRYEKEFYTNEERAKAINYIESKWKNESYASQARHVSDFLNADPPVSKSTWMGWFNRKNKIISQSEDETVCKTKTRVWKIQSLKFSTEL